MTKIKKEWLLLSEINLINWTGFNDLVHTNKRILSQYTIFSEVSLNLLDSESVLLTLLLTLSHSVSTGGRDDLFLKGPTHLTDSRSATLFSSAQFLRVRPLRCSTEGRSRPVHRFGFFPKKPLLGSFYSFFFTGVTKVLRITISSVSS